MRVLVGLMLLAAGIVGGAFLLLPLVEERLSQTQAEGLAETAVSSTTRRTFKRDPLAPSPTIPPTTDDHVRWTPVKDFGRGSSSPRVELPIASSQAPPGAPIGTRPTNRLTSSKPADADARRELTKDLQGELKRVGCYEGEIDGRWGPETKRAMGAFTDRVNATLPVEDPDYILLALVQGHAARTCGNACPPGQELGSGGRCLPRTIIARRVRQDASKAEPRTAFGLPVPADRGAAEAMVPHAPLSAFKAAVSSRDTGAQSGDLTARTPPPGQMTGSAARPATTAPASTAAPREMAAAAGAKSDAHWPMRKAKADHPARSYLGARTPQLKSVAAQRPGMLPAAKSVRSAERPSKKRLSVARAPLYRTTPPTSRTPSRYALRLAAWWRRWQYAVYYGGYGGMAGPWR
jgi:hypothetical protein